MVGVNSRGEVVNATSSPIYRWRVGEVEITRVLEFEAALFEPVVIYPEATPQTIEQHRSWLQPSLMDRGGRLVFAFHSTIIKTPRATILVDTCSGNDKERPHKLRYHRKTWPYLANLAAAGFAPEEIDYVLCTHLQFDLCLRLAGLADHLDRFRRADAGLNSYISASCCSNRVSWLRRRKYFASHFGVW